MKTNLVFNHIPYLQCVTWYQLPDILILKEYLILKHESYICNSYSYCCLNTVGIFYFNSLILDNCANNNCQTNATCTVTDSAYECNCTNGFQGNGTHCTGIPLYRAFVIFSLSSLKLLIILLLYPYMFLGYFVAFGHSSKKIKKIHFMSKNLHLMSTKHSTYNKTLFTSITPRYAYSHWVSGNLTKMEDLAHSKVSEVLLHESFQHFSKLVKWMYFQGETSYLTLRCLGKKMMKDIF